MQHLDGVTFGGYRSFGSAEPVRLRHLSKVNLIAGQNNSGKSNVLRALGMFVDKAGGGGQSHIDRPSGEGEHQITTGFALNVTTAVGMLCETRPSADTGRVGNWLREAFASPRILDEDQIWFEFDGWGTAPRRRGLTPRFAQELAESVNSSREAAAQRLINHLRLGAVRGTAVEALHTHLRGNVGEFPKLELVSGVREIRHVASEDKQDLNGLNLKRRLARLQNPSTDRLTDRATFDAITQFVRRVLEDDEVTLDVPHDLSTIHVTQRGTTLPIESLGTGIHEVVILAAASTVVRDSIVCIEEPEIHLHPVLQRKLLTYLATETDNQYFIATHSAHMLDASLGTIHHVQLVEGRSQIDYVGDARAQSHVCVDLGYRPSDLVQANAVIWVEGPSDRLYIKHWIEALAPTRFVEGVHYSIMFYGGGLLSSLTPDDEVIEFISLRRLNRYMVVVMDSDKTSARKSLNSSKQRVKVALEEDPETGHAWITAGYTIENYLPWTALRPAIVNVHPSSKPQTPPSQYENPLRSDRIGITSPNKPKIAREVLRSWGDEWPLDLKKQVSAVVSLIERANRSA